VATTVARVRVHHLRQMKEQGQRWAMLTAYDASTASALEAAGVPVLLIGDSAANVIYGYRSSVEVSVEELLPLVSAVARSTSRVLVLADLPFGSYEASPQQALATAVRFLKAGAHAVKLEGGARMAEQVRLLTSAGIPVMGHIGFTPQSEHALGGYRVQGRGSDAQRLLHDAVSLEEAGAFAVLMEMVPADAAARITKQLSVPTVGIGAGAGCDAQVLVWQDLAGLSTGRRPRFVKQYAQVGAELASAAQQFAREVADGTFPGPEHSF